MRSTSIRVGELRFDALACGPTDGPLVVLLHGFPQSSETWRPLLEVLGIAGWHAVAPTQRGYAAGARPRGRAAYALHELVADVLGMADQLGAETFHVVGHDWGGVVAWAVGARHPDRVTTLTSLSTPHPAALARSMIGWQALRSTYALFFQAPVVPEALLSAGHNGVLRVALERSGLSHAWAQRYADALAPEALRAALNWYRATNPFDHARVPAVTVPTLFVWGRHDTALGPAAAAGTERFVDAPYRFVELDAGHWLPEEHEAEVAPLVQAHLHEHTTPSTRPPS